MKSIQRTVLEISTALLLTIASLAHAAANPDPPDVDPDIMARVAKERTKRATTATGQNAAALSKADSNVACGAVDIGNVNTGGRIGMTPPQITVVITGDVISANNVCK
jgi:predicted nicotinamide N-methyase